MILCSLALQTFQNEAFKCVLMSVYVMSAHTQPCIIAQTWEGEFH